MVVVVLVGLGCWCTMGNGGEKLDGLKKKQAVLKARIEQMEAREKTLAKKQDLRRKILLGAFVLEEALRDDKVAELYQKMDKFLVRNSDRVLFNLPLLEKATGVSPVSGGDGGK